jgi:hypothetical protein
VTGSVGILLAEHVKRSLPLDTEWIGEKSIAALEGKPLDVVIRIRPRFGQLTDGNPKHADVPLLVPKEAIESEAESSGGDASRIEERSRLTRWRGTAAVAIIDPERRILPRLVQSAACTRRPFGNRWEDGAELPGVRPLVRWKPSIFENPLRTTPTKSDQRFVRRVPSIADFSEKSCMIA